jgi:hypothetical protein
MVSHSYIFVLSQRQNNVGRKYREILKSRTFSTVLYLSRSIQKHLVTYYCITVEINHNLKMLFERSRSVRLRLEIPASLETEMGGSQFKASPGETPISTNSQAR